VVSNRAGNPDSGHHLGCQHGVGDLQDVLGAIVEGHGPDSVQRRCYCGLGHKPVLLLRVIGFARGRERHAAGEVPHGN
jgi:hypothetical protein